MTLFTREALIMCTHHKPEAALVSSLSQHKPREAGHAEDPVQGQAPVPAAPLLYSTLKHHLLQAAQFIPC